MTSDRISPSLKNKKKNKEKKNLKASEASSTPAMHNGNRRMRAERQRGRQNI